MAVIIRFIVTSYGHQLRSSAARLVAWRS